MELADLLIGPIPWVAKNQDPTSLDARIVCTVFSVFRNLSFYPFLSTVNSRQKAEIQKKLKGILSSKAIKHTIELKECNPLELTMLKERFLLPRSTLEKARQNGLETAFDKSSLVLTDDGMKSALINVNEHLTYSSYKAGYCGEKGKESIPEMLDDLCQETWAYDSELGYLNSNPALAGTGFRVSALIHFPGNYKSRSQESLLRALNAVNLTVFGDGDLEGNGDLVWVSSRKALGQNEIQIFMDFHGKLMKFLEIERELEDEMYKKGKTKIEDTVFRSFYNLISARILPYAEFLNLSSWAKLGVYLGLLNPKLLELINILMVKSCSAHIQLGESPSPSSDEKNEIRATMVRLTLKECME